MSPDAGMVAPSLTNFRQGVRDAVFTELGRAVVLLAAEHTAGRGFDEDFVDQVWPLIEDANRIIEQV